MKTGNYPYPFKTTKPNSIMASTNGIFNFTQLSHENMAKLNERVSGNVLIIVVAARKPFLQTVPIENVVLLEQKQDKLILHTKTNGVKYDQEILDFRWVYSAREPIQKR